MTLTILLAQLFGLYIIVKGLFILIRPKEARRLMKEVSENRALLYILGMAATFLGIILALSHNLWGSLPEAVVSIFAWLTLVKGIAILFAPQATLNVLGTLSSSESDMRGVASVILIIGLYLVYVGFGL